MNSPGKIRLRTAALIAAHLLTVACADQPPWEGVVEIDYRYGAGSIISGERTP